LSRSIKGDDIVKFIKTQRIRWLGHIKRMEVGATPRKMMEGRLFIGRRKGRPRLRWMDDDAADLKVMEIKRWMEKTKYRESNGDWLLRRPRLTQDCSAERMDGITLMLHGQHRLRSFSVCSFIQTKGISPSYIEVSLLASFLKHSRGSFCTCV
jgi:hypothetical protein